jgi:hypothetical protein
VTDALGATADSSSLSLTVDNTPPLAALIAPALNAQNNGPTLFSAHASDGFGIKSVQYTVDGTAVGALLTAPDLAGQFVYSTTFDTSTLPVGSHSVSAVVTDNAGNTTTAPAVTIKTGPAGAPLQLVPVINFHGIEATPADVYQLTPAQADAQLKYLRDNGYQSIDLEQYKTWLDTGTLPTGITKPVLITVDDALTDQLAWDPLLQTYGFKAILYVITGFADNLTPGDADPAQNLSWDQIKAFAANGRREMAWHAGLYGHGDSYGTGGTTINGAIYPASLSLLLHLPPVDRRRDANGRCLQGGRPERDHERHGRAQGPGADREHARLGGPVQRRRAVDEPLQRLDDAGPGVVPRVHRLGLPDRVHPDQPDHVRPGIRSDSRLRGQPDRARPQVSVRGPDWNDDRPVRSSPQRSRVRPLMADGRSQSNV